jgi:dUTP pyrophosphatase
MSQDDATHEVKLRIMRAETADPSIALPHYATPGAAGADMRANFGVGGGMVILPPQERALIPTGLCMAIPDGFEVQVRPRSGLALKHGVTLLNSPGTIDSDYRGEVGVIMINLGQERFEITHGMRIAQMVVASVVQTQFAEVVTLDTTARGAKGLGSAGHMQ